MDEATKSDLIQGLSSDVRSNLASVWRTVEWHLIDPKRIGAAQHAGATCGRLLKMCLQNEHLASDVRKTLTGLAVSLTHFDAAEAAERAEILAVVRSGLLTVVPLGEMGAGRQDLKRVGRLIKPKGRDRRKKAGSDREVTAESGGPAGEAAAKGDSNEIVVAPSDSTASDDALGAKSAASDEEAAARQQDRENRRQEPPREPRKRRLSVGDPEGTGRPVAALDGCDADMAARLEGCGVHTVMDLLNCAPSGHVRGQLANLSAESAPDDVASDADVVVRGKIQNRCTRMGDGKATRELRLDLNDGTTMRCAWDGGTPRGWNVWHAGMEIALLGRPESTDDGWTLSEAEPVGVDGRGSGQLPNYSIDGVADRELRDVIAEALVDSLGALRDPMPDRLIDLYRLLPLDQAYREAHFPSNVTGRGRERLAFEELLMLQAGIAWRGRGQHRTRGIGLKIAHHNVGDLGAQQGFFLSDGQERAFSDIRRGLQSRQPMARLLQGEVGTDKASIALMAAVLVADSAAQVVYILPDDMAAERRYLFSEGMLRSVGIASMRIVSKPDRGQLDALSRGACQVVFGTKDILDAKPEWKRLGLVIVEERDEYGTVDPSQFVDNGPAPDLLVITDTPIPSSLALTIFGEFEVSIITRDDPMRVAAEVHAVEARAEAYAAAREQIEQGRQAYVCFPVGEAGDLLSTDDALRFAEALQQDAFPDARIAVYCAAMSGEDRLRVFHDFDQRRIDVLVCTTYIEEAPVVSNATAMVIEHADRYDLIRLHRLRGHVGHGHRKGICQLIFSDDPAEEGRARVDQLMSEDDGYRIAEIDLQDRGASAVLGDRASELPVFSWTDPIKDRALLLRAREESFKMVRQDPGMRRFSEFGRALRFRWGAWLGDGLPDPGEARGSSGSDGSDGGGGRRRRRRRRRRR